ncbi:LysR substrate-binding domain-containing protein [Amphritea balenae]|uniref:LysR family transcriptional regulator n=1 Tax=Amphritea balenae TaxID=452629 RepID=A0A3P1SRB8_9GAMM|nr:LysR substrate-binding domain-containing protein [Amphritea balenae]RRC99660.1 LysR family transcriptional regulator [Amphritea balenae]GGK78746.1 LysR family transcriptional regulator [Amphritea balenae]
MRRNLPPLNSVKAFEAAARQLSFTAAAEELCVTQSAISKQIKQLELYIGEQLFERTPNQLILTDKGSRYLAVISVAMDSIDQATAELKRSDKSRESLRLDMLPSLSSIWLIPRLQQFEHCYPELNVELISGEGIPDFVASEADLAIRCFKQDSAPAKADLLLPERLLLVASAELIKRKPIRQIEDLTQHKLLAQTTRPAMWQTFFQQLNLNPELCDPGIAAQHFFMSLQSVKEGLGIALIPDFLVQSELETGQLVAPLGLSMVSSFGYYLSAPEHKRHQLKVRQFSQWLVDNLARSQIIDRG